MSQWTVTVKDPLKTDPTVYQFADPKFIGRDVILETETTYIGPGRASYWPPPSRRGAVLWLAAVLAVVVALALATAARGEPIPLRVIQAPSGAAPDALAEVNAKRAQRGLRPYALDPALAKAAQRCADYRAARLQFGHVMHGMGDFQFLDPGVACGCTGCAAYPDSYGWMSCAVYDNYTYAGAAWARGADGKRYMQLYCR